MKNNIAAFAICLVLALTACKSKSSDNASGSSGGKDTSSGKGSNSGGPSATPALSNVDTTLDSAKMPAHVDSAGNKK